MIFCSSWDDGSLEDMKLSDLLSKYNHKATFYIPINNTEGREVISNTEIRELIKTHEVGSHTLDHLYLTELSDIDAYDQIKNGKDELENIVGGEVPGFCYPGGKFKKQHIRFLKEIGIKHARTVENMRIEMAECKYRVPTTLQFYPHKNSAYLSNFIQGSNKAKKMIILNKVLSSKKIVDKILYIIESGVMGSDSIFHLWGHSWEIEKMGMWSDLEILLSYMDNFQVENLTISDLVDDKV
jgi:peptidoglycan/xylan/chitin deacetylase (PgdA/CDA1 family)